jgi:hypothetical protein
MALPPQAYVGIAKVGLKILGGILGSKKKKKQAAQQEAHNKEIEARQRAYRAEIIAYKEEQFEQDVEHYGALVTYQAEEGAKHRDFAERQTEVIKDTFTSQFGAQMRRIAEIDIANYLGIENINTQETAVSGSLQVAQAESGVGGKSAALLRGEVERQAGVARVSANLQGEANRRQGIREAVSLKASRDSALGAITLPTFNPLRAPGAITPTDAVKPAAPVSRPSTLSTVINVASTAVDAYQGLSDSQKFFK